MKFVAIDVETANADMTSICQIMRPVQNTGKTMRSTELSNKNQFVFAVSIDLTASVCRLRQPKLIQDEQECDIAFCDDNVLKGQILKVTPQVLGSE